MREWLNIVGVLLIPILIAAYTIVNNIQQTTLAQQQHANDQHIAQQNRLADVANQLDQQRETALKTYEDDISNLLLDRHLATSRPGDEVRTIALAKTLEVLHQLDGPRNVRIIRFLHDAQLIGVYSSPRTPYNIINFSGSDLTDDNLTGAYLGGIDLTNTFLDRAILIGVNLIGVNLTEASLSGANLSEAKMVVADLNNAFLDRSNLTGADFGGADLTGANLSEANLSEANLSEANLSGSDLTGANLSRANLSGTHLSGTHLSGAIMPDGTKHSCQQGYESFCK